MTVLVTGFGSFPGVDDNPTAHLARAVDGAFVAGVPVVGRVLPVSYTRGPDAALAAAAEVGARLVLGLGVATARTEVCVERTAVWAEEGRPDIDDEVRTGLRGPPTVSATLDVQRLAAALGARVSDDAGRYVCNAWLYRVSTALDVPVAFVHVPPSGLAPAALLSGLQAVLASG